MNFYCPKCQAEREVEPNGTVTTKTNRVAYKGSCPECGQEMAEFSSFEPQPTPIATPPTPPLPDAAPVNPAPIVAPHEPLETPIPDPASEAAAQAALDAAAVDISQKQ